jgi:hypothetical protein
LIALAGFQSAQFRQSIWGGANLRVLMRHQTALRLTLALATIGAAVVITVAILPGSRRSLRHGDPVSILQEPSALLVDPARTLQTLRSLGVNVVRVSVAWDAVAPVPASRTRPQGFRAADPGSYPATRWMPFDAIVDDASRDGIEPDLVLTGNAPLWASGPAPTRTERVSGLWSPSPAAYGQFVQAVATRYSGSYRPPGASTPLPRVHFWEIWNEPNWGPSLQPQLALNPPRIVSAVEYRRLVDAAWSALRRTGHRGDTVVVGSLSPRGLTAPPESTSALQAAIDVSSPLGFTRTLYCVDSSYKPLRGRAAALAGCPTVAGASRRFREEHPALFEATGYGIHPYPINGPPTEDNAANPDTVEFGEIPNLESALDRVQRAYGSRRRMSVYNTEYGYITRPPNPNPGYISPATAARYLNWAEYLTWRDPRMASTMQYELYDPNPAPDVFGPGGFATGLIFYGGKPKATFYAYRMPIFLPVTRAASRQALEVWGCVRPAPYAYLDTDRPQYVRIQFRAARAGRFLTVRTIRLTAARGCYFDVHVGFPASGTVRLAWSYPADDPRLHDPVTPGQTTIYSRDVTLTVR